MQTAAADLTSDSLHYEHYCLKAAGSVHTTKIKEHKKEPTPDIN